MDLIDELSLGLEEKSQEQKRNVPVILDGKFFEVVSSTLDGNVKAKCITCVSNKTSVSASIISGRYQPSSNFTTHLKRKHPEAFKEYENYKATDEPKVKRKNQPRINFPVTKESAFKTKAERLITKYIVNTMKPLSTVVEDDFKELVTGLNPEVTVMSRETLRNRIDSQFKLLISKTKSDLDSTSWVCLTTDIWSARNRSFLGVTSHWLDSSMNRKSAILSLQRFAGKHSSDKILEKLSDIILNKFGIDNKLVAVVTDNGSNFVKAMKEYGVNLYHEMDEVESEIDEIELETGIQLESDEVDYKVPQHFRCASHTISLIATKDVDFYQDKPSQASGREKSIYKRSMRTAFAKCSALWNKCGRSVQAAESAKAITGKSMTRPVVTRWNSLFDSVVSLLESKEKLNDLFQALNVEKLKVLELEFLEEYVTAMLPLATHLDKLQKEKDFYFGQLAPYIWKTFRDLDTIITTPSKHGFSAAIAADLKIGLSKRFKAIIDFDTGAAEWEILSAILLPWFKLFWIPKKFRESAKRFFVERAVSFAKQQHIDEEKLLPENNEWSVYYDGDQSSSEPVPEHDTSNIELKCLAFLDDRRTTTEIFDDKKYIVLKNMFLKYNTPIPSSAPAERLFSYGGMILRPQRSCLSDELFEQLVMLKLNKFL